MKNTSVTPSATLERMPRPNHSVKIGASTTRGSELIVFTNGSKIVATSGLRANQKPTSTPASEPIVKASSASISVTHRWRQIVPCTNHLTMRSATSTGVEKKNGGSTITPKIGTLVKNHHRPSAAAAASDCRSRRTGHGTTRPPPGCSP